MCKRAFVTPLWLGLLATLGGCIPASTPSPLVDDPSEPVGDMSSAAVPTDGISLSAESLWAEWEVLAKDPLLHLGNPRTAELGSMLYSLGVEHALRLADILADPAAPAERKVLVTVALQNVIDPKLVERLIPLISTDLDDVTRSCATQIIALQPDENTKVLLSGLLEDRSANVRLAALQGLALMSDPSAIETLRAMYDDPAGTPPVRDRIVQTLARYPQRDSLPIYRAALVDPLLEPSSRFAAAAAICEFGDVSDLPLLEEAAAFGGSDQFKNVLELAKVQVSSRPVPDASSPPEETPNENPEMPE